MIDVAIRSVMVDLIFEKIDWWNYQDKIMDQIFRKNRTICCFRNSGGWFLYKYWAVEMKWSMIDDAMKNTIVISTEKPKQLMFK